jgi:hypothetical protein
MKKTRLLEIIREEIALALNETSYAGIKAIPDMKNDPSYKTLNQTGKMDAEKELKTGGTVELEEEKRKKLAEKYQIDEEIINEMASIKQLKSELEKQGKEKELEAIKATEKATLDALKQDPTITPDGRLKGYVSAFKKELKNAHGINLQDLLTVTSIGAEGKFNDDIATNTIEKDAANQLTGKEAGQRGRKADPNKPEKAPSTGKRGRPASATSSPKKATLTKGDDGFDDVSYSEPEGDEAAAAVGSDETAKELGKSVPQDKIEKFNTGLKFIKKYKDDKKIIDAYLKKAKDEYKLPANMIKDLKKAAGREVEI